MERDKKEERRNAFTSVASKSGAQGDPRALDVCVSWLYKQAGAFASAGEESLARHSASAGGSASLSLSQMWAYFPGVSPWRHACAEFGAGQRAGGDVVSVGTLVWSGVVGVRELGRAALQDARLRDGASGGRPRARSQARGSL